MFKFPNLTEKATGHEVDYLILDDPVTVTDATAPTITKHATPFNGEHVDESVTNATPIFTTSGKVYVAAPVTRATVQQKRVATLNSSTWATIEDVQVRAVSHNANIGHRGSGIAVSGSRILVGAAYNETWVEKTSTSNLASLSSVTDPTSGLQVAYWQYSVNPTNGDIYLFPRVGTASPRFIRLYKWNGTGWTEMIRPGDSGSYMAPLAFNSSGDILLSVGLCQPDNDSGYPRILGSVVRSPDDGVTWVVADGTTALLPCSKSTRGDFAYPEGTFNLIRIAVDGNDNPVLLASFQAPGSSHLELWQATWDGNKFVHRKILDHPTGADGGDVDIAYYNGTIVATVAEYGIIDDPVNGPQTPYPTGKLWLLVTDDGAQSWTRYELHDADLSHGYCGAYLDPTSMAVDGVVRLLPMDLVDPTSHEVWELTLP